MAMFGRTVDIDGTEVFVFCTPETPYSEILQRAAEILRKEEREENRARIIWTEYV
jgi:hypothetical protein